MNILNELNQIAEELNAIPERRQSLEKEYYEIKKSKDSYFVYNNRAGIIMASGLSFQQAFYVLNILKSVKIK